ncbi:MAG TPA: PQQ-binding-like beta-propeller repeat protein [Candidatus Andersenbacteria bacterium]|nr:PQQ-binding-like beta-propeller repeat protein [Candidatus Andersenbacteria bacterium]
MRSRSLLVGVILIVCCSIIGFALYAFLSSGAGPKNNLVHALLPLSRALDKQVIASTIPQEFTTVWFTDYSGDKVEAVDRATGNVTWEQIFSFPSIQESGQASNIEFMTIAPNGDPIITTSNGMLIQELNRASHEVVWQYGLLNQQYCNKCLHQPKKAYLINNGTEVLVTDANNRRVVIINKATKQIVWEYGHKAVMKDAPGYLKGNRFAMALDNQASKILISDTLTNKIMIIDRATKQIVWQWEDTGGKWLQNVFPTQDGTFVAEDHLKNEVFEVNKDGQVLWKLHQLADGTTLNYPTDAVRLGNGNVIISEGGRRRIIEVNPNTGEIVWQFKAAGLPTSIAVE